MSKVDFEQNLISGFLAGESLAYETVNSWISAVLNLRSWHMSIRAARDDIRQEVLMALTQNFRRNKYKGKGLKTYVSSITKFTCLKAYDRVAVVSESDRDVETGQPSALERLIRDEKLQEMREGIRRLGFTCRKILALRFYNDLDHIEIARALGVTVTTSRQRLKRCLDELRKLVKTTKYA